MDEDIQSKMDLICYALLLIVPVYYNAAAGLIIQNGRAWYQLQLRPEKQAPLYNCPKEASHNNLTFNKLMQWLIQYGQKII